MNDFYKGLAEILEVDADEVTPDMDLREAGWDSMAVVMTLALVDDLFGVMPEGQALLACNTVSDIEKLIDAAKKG